MGTIDYLKTVILLFSLLLLPCKTTFTLKQQDVFVRKSYRRAPIISFWATVDVLLYYNPSRSFLSQWFSCLWCLVWKPYWFLSVASFNLFSRARCSSNSTRFCQQCCKLEALLSIDATSIFEPKRVLVKAVVVFGERWKVWVGWGG